jgi:hypothetical protein
MSEILVEDVRREVEGAMILVSSSKVLFGIDTVPRLVPMLRSRNQKVLGLDGFSTDGHGMFPEQYIADFSDLEDAEESYDALLRVISVWKDETGPQFVEVTLE